MGNAFKHGMELMKRLKAAKDEQAWATILDDAIAGAEAQERELWAKKFEFWAKCADDGLRQSMNTRLLHRAEAWKDCTRVLRENDNWMPAAASTPQVGDADG